MGTLHGMEFFFENNFRISQMLNVFKLFGKGRAIILTIFTIEKPF